jgi:hypothetical protein
LRPLLPHGVVLSHGATAKAPDWTMNVAHAGLHNPLIRALKRMGLMGHKSNSKWVPDAYRLGSPEIRLAVLQGLLDTDGYVGPDGAIEYSSASAQLMGDVQFIVWTLGGRCRVVPKVVDGTTYYRTNISLPSGIVPFRTPRRLAKFIPRTKYEPTRCIDRVEPAGEKECVCIAVEAPDGLYVTDDCIVTHNTSQAIAALVATRAYPCIVVCPASVRENWVKEFGYAASVPSIEVVTGRRGILYGAQVIVCTYDVLLHRERQLAAMRPRLIMFDEAQTLKEPRPAPRHRAAVATRLAHYIGCAIELTGTPILNRPKELFRLLHIAAPKRWTSYEDFNDRYCKPQQ